VDRIELDARTARCARHLDREGVRKCIFAAKLAFLAGDHDATRIWIELAECAAGLTIEGAAA
jgi:hypothetical protein